MPDLLDQIADQSAVSAKPADLLDQIAGESATPASQSLTPPIPKLPTPGIVGQLWETAWKAPKSAEDYVDVERGIRANQLDTTLKIRENAAKHGFDPDDFEKAPGAVSLVAQGGFDELVDLAKMSISPGGVLSMQLGTAAKIPMAVKRVVSLAFAVQMLKQTPENYRAFMEEMRKPPAERDYVKIGRTGAGTVASGVLGLLGLKGGLAPSKPTTPPVEPSAPAAKPPIPAPAPTIMLSRDEATPRGREGVQEIAAKYSLSWDEAVALLAKERKRLGMVRDVAQPTEPPAPEATIAAEPVPITKSPEVSSKLVVPEPTQPVISEKPPELTEADVRKDLVEQGLADLQPNERAEVQAALEKLKRFEDLNPREQALLDHLRNWVNKEMEAGSEKPPEVKPAQPPATAKVGVTSKPVVQVRMPNDLKNAWAGKLQRIGTIGKIKELEEGWNKETNDPHQQHKLELLAERKAEISDERNRGDALQQFFDESSPEMQRKIDAHLEKLNANRKLTPEEQQFDDFLEQQISQRLNKSKPQPTPPPPAVTTGKVAAKPSAEHDYASWLKSKESPPTPKSETPAIEPVAAKPADLSGPGSPSVRQGPDTGGGWAEGDGGDVYGIAQRVREARAKAGQVAPVAAVAKSPIEVLNTESNVKISVPKGATMVRVTDKAGKTSVQSLSNVQGENVFKGADIQKIEAGTIGKDKKFVLMAGDVAIEPKKTRAQAIAEFPKSQVSRGPGAAAGGEPGTYSAIQQLADQISETGKDTAPVNEKISAIEKVRVKAGEIGDSVKSALANVLAIKKAVWDSYAGLAPYTDMKRIVGKWFYANQRADAEAAAFGKTILKAVPDKTRREAITNWIQADGDVAILKDRAAASKPTYRKGYEIAQNLTPREIEIAQMLREYYDKQLEKGISEGLLKDGLENYITQVWKKENPITRKLMNDLVNSKLQPNFKFARKRIFDSYFEGEQAGYKPSKDAGFLVSNYDQSFNRSLAARAFIKDLHEGLASDGRPLVEVSGSGKMVDAGEAKPRFIIKPKATPEAIGDYKTIDHPALRGWKWIGKTPEGADVLLQGELKVHPEIYDKLKNRLSTSWFRQHPVPRAVLGVQSTLKQSMISISGFHQVQENLHALGHRVNPMNLEKLDFSEPVTKSLVEHGLQIADYNSLAEFGEGLSSGKLLSKIPFLGSKLQAYNDWLFQDNIPRLKLTMAKHALERNKERYADSIKSGKITPDQVLELTASQANHAFGELPYKYWGRNPNLQDFYRAFLLAPDFLEARAGFVGQALKPGGLGAKGLLKNEQLQALALLAVTQYVTARIANQIIDDDPHWEMKNAFRIIHGTHAYSLRTVPGDVIHLMSDPRGFTFNRLSPVVGRGGIELATSRDYRGVKRDFLEQMGDLLKSGIPISLSRKNGQNILESFGNAMGVQNQRYDAEQNIQQKAADFKSANNIKTPYETVYNPDADKFAALRNFIQEGNQKSAQVEFNKLAQTVPPEKIYEHFKLSLNRSLTGSKANDAKFYNGLNEVGKMEYKEAKDLQKSRLRLALSLRRSK